MATRGTDKRKGEGQSHKGRKRLRDARCSFCSKGAQDVGPLVEGTGNVYICAECIHLCRDIIDHEKARRQPDDPHAYLRTKLERLEELVEEMKVYMDPRFAPVSENQLPASPDVEGRSS